MMPLEPATSRYYAMDQLGNLREEISQGIGNMVIYRAKVEKYRESKRPIAKAAYEDLQKLRLRLVKKLGALQPVLQELELYQQSQGAGQLQQGLATFPLLSSGYKALYDGFMAYLDGLPLENDTTSAAIIGRLMNNVKLGFYPTDPGNIAFMADALVWPDGVTPNLLDPCCGCGEALAQMAQGISCHTYGVELDESRGEEAQACLERVAVGSYFQSRISLESFHVLFLNPPYLSVLQEGGGRSRHEKRFLVESIKHLVYGGILFYILPYYRLTTDVCRVLSDNFTNLSVWRFTKGEFEKFKQVVVIGQRTPRTEDEAKAKQLEQYGYDAASIPAIDQLQPQSYEVPAIDKAIGLFKGAVFNEAELARQLAQSESIRKLLSKSELDHGQKRPLLPLSIGQIGLIGGSGLINGVVDCDTPHIMKGRIIKVTQTESQDQYSAKGNHIGQVTKEVISNKMIFNVLTPNGVLPLA